MAAELKSSDEILQELFGMCSSTSKKSIHSSSESSHSKSDVEDDASTTKKHKKKKKKHKKLKKRGRSSSDESDSTDHKTHKRKKKKSHKDDDKSKKLKIKIKTEPGEPEESFNDLGGAEKKKDSLMDTATGRKLTIDDVFNSLGIIKTEIKKEKGLSPVRKNEENGCDEKQAEDSKEALILPALPPALLNREPTDKVQLKVEKDKETTSDQTADSTKSKLDDVFDKEPNQLAEKNKSKTKKINIDNLKNSCVYEATIKEVEERERKKAEKYEEGELSSSSNSSQNDMTDDDGTETANDTDSKKKEKRRHKHKHRSKSKSHERSRSKHRSRSHHSKHGHEHSHEKEKPSHKTHRSGKSSVSPTRHSRSTKSHHDHYHHSAHHRSYYSYYSRASSVEGRGSPRSRRSRDDKRGKSSDRSHSRTGRKSRSKSTEKIDKQKLLEIARKNAITLLKQGALPASVIVNKEKITSIKAGGKTVDELTDFCKLLSKKEAEGQESLSSGSELDEEREKAFHHPFQLKERPSSIVMNIRNAVPLPTKTAQEKTLELSKTLSLQYPVSSGQHHRVTESEWVPVEKTPDPAPAPVIVPPPAPIVPAAPVKIPGNQPFHALDQSLVAYPNIAYNNGYTNQIPLPQAPNNDIGSIVAERLEAIRRLTENPSDPIGNNLIQVADTKMKVWAESKVQPGLFTGSTGVRTLSAAELGSGFKAWPKKNQFIVAKPVVSDKGEALMKKMGWQPGEGLGKYKQGPPEPCEIAMKTDRKGLAEQTVSFQQQNPVKRAFELSQNKHPVSLLNEYCSRKKIGVPSYDCEEKEGAGKRKLFLFSVTVKGMTYTPQMPCCNKKQSKIEAATLCLQNLGLLPRS